MHLVILLINKMHALFNPRINKILMCLACLGTLVLSASHVQAQEQQEQQEQVLIKEMMDGVIAETALVEDLETPEELPEMEAYAQVRIRALDKITARTETIELKIGDMVEFGALTITGKACRKSAPIENPESAAFLQVWEFPLDSIEKEIIDNAELRFSGWMFASSPGLSAMDHPIYDIWVLDCIGEAVDEEAMNEQQPDLSDSAASDEGSDIKNLDLLEAIHTETIGN